MEQIKQTEEYDVILLAEIALYKMSLSENIGTFLAGDFIEG